MGTMPRREPLPKEELQICNRIAAFRSERNITRASLAKQIGINQFSLANIERGLAPVRFIIGYNFCQAFNRSLMWLANGKLPRSVFTPLSREVTARFGPRWLFSKAYNEGLGALVEGELRSIAEQMGKKAEDLDQVIVLSNARVGAGSHAAEHYERTKDFLEQWRQGMTDEQLVAFSNQLADVCFRFFNSRGQGKPIVDTPGNSVTVPLVSADVPNWKKLVAEVKRLTKEQGAKAALAAELETSRQNVNKWLSGDGAPSADLTLALLRWVRSKQAK